MRAPPSVGDGAQGVGTDTRLDITTAKAIFHSEILAPLVREGVVDAKEFVKGLNAALREPATMTVAALCLFSTAGKVAQDNLAVEAVEGLFRSSFEDHKNSDGLVSFSALSSTGTFKDWAAATAFDATSTPNEDGKQQHVNNFNDFEELSRLCERCGAQSGICLLKNAWLQETFAEAQRTGVPFLLPSRNALPSDASNSGPITEDQVYIIALSYCWAGPGQPDPENRLLSDVSELLGYLDASRHFGDDDPVDEKLNIAGGVDLLGLPVSVPKVRPHDAGRDSVAARQLRAGPWVDQRLVRSRRDAVPAMHRELSSGEAHRVQTLRVAVLRVAGLDDDQGPKQSRRPAHRAQLGPPCWQQEDRNRQQQGHFTGCSNTCGGRRGSCRWIRTRSMTKLRENTPRTAAT